MKLYFKVTESLLIINLHRTRYEFLIVFVVLKAINLLLTSFQRESERGEERIAWRNIIIIFSINMNSKNIAHISCVKKSHYVDTTSHVMILMLNISPRQGESVREGRPTPRLVTGHTLVSTLVEARTPDGRDPRSGHSKS